MGEEQVRKVLKSFGLTQKEAEVYLFLSKHGVQKGTDIAKRMRIHKAEAYRFLKSLQSKGLVESTLESPARFTAVPFAKALDLFVKLKRDEAALIESTKQNLLVDWEKISKTKPELPLEKFVVIEGSNKIYPKIAQMVKETTNQLSAITTVQSLARVERLGIFDEAFAHPLRPKIQFRFLTEPSQENIDILKNLLQRIPKANFNFKGRNPDLGFQLSSRMVIRDEEEMIFFINPKTEIDKQEHEDTCFWTNCKSLVQSFTGVFEELWRGSVDIQETINPVNGNEKKPRFSMVGRTAEKKYQEALSSVKKEIFIVASSQGLAELSERSELQKWVDQGINLRFMAPIIGGNFKAAQQLSKFGQVRHIPEGYLRTTLIDGKYLFHFKDSLTVFSNDVKYNNSMKSKLENAWKNAQPPSAVTLEAILNPPDMDAERLPKEIPGEAYSKGTIRFEDHVEGTLTEKDVVSKIMNATRIKAKDPKKDITAYATVAVHTLSFIRTASSCLT